MCTYSLRVAVSLTFLMVSITLLVIRIIFYIIAIPFYYSRKRAEIWLKWNMNNGFNLILNSIVIFLSVAPFSFLQRLSNKMFLHKMGGFFARHNCRYISFIEWKGNKSIPPVTQIILHRFLSICKIKLL